MSWSQKTQNGTSPCQALCQFSEKVWSVFLMVDCGYGRDGSLDGDNTAVVLWLVYMTRKCKQKFINFGDIQEAWLMFVHFSGDGWWMLMVPIWSPQFWRHAFLGFWVDDPHIYQAVFSPLLSSASRCWPGRSAVLRDGERLGGVAPDATGGALYPWRPFLWRPGRAGWALGDGGWDLGETWGRLGGNRETLRIVWVYGDLFQEDWQWLARMGHFCKHGAEHVVSKKVIDWCLRSSHTQT